MSAASANCPNICETILARANKTARADEPDHSENLGAGRLPAARNGGLPRSPGAVSQPSGKRADGATFLRRKAANARAQSQHPRFAEGGSRVASRLL